MHAKATIVEKIKAQGSRWLEHIRIPDNKVAIVRYEGIGGWKIKVRLKERWYQQVKEDREN